MALAVYQILGGIATAFALVFLVFFLRWSHKDGERYKGPIEYWSVKLFYFVMFIGFLGAGIASWIADAKQNKEGMTLVKSFKEEVTTKSLQAKGGETATHEIPKGLYAGMHYGAATTSPIGASADLVSFLAPHLDNTKTQPTPGSDIVFHLKSKPSKDMMQRVITLVLQSVTASERKDVIVVSQQGPGAEHAIYAVLDKGINFNDTASYPDVLSTIYRQ